MTLEVAADSLSIVHSTSVVGIAVMVVLLFARIVNWMML